MDLKLKDVADLLNVSKTTIRRWLADGKIPAYRINNQYRFNRHEIEDWVMRHRVESTDNPLIVDTEEQASAEKAVGNRSGGMKQFSLFRAIHHGGVLDSVPGRSKEEIIRNTMAVKAQDLNLDGAVLTDLLLDREQMMPTSLLKGIGVPHTRDCLLAGQQDAVIVVFPEAAIEYGALDGQPVHTLFFLFACDDKRHLHLLAKIAHLASHEGAAEFLQTRPDKASVLNYIKEWEAQIQQMQTA